MDSNRRRNFICSPLRLYLPGELAYLSAHVLHRHHCKPQIRQGVARFFFTWKSEGKLKTPQSAGLMKYPETFHWLSLPSMGVTVSIAAGELANLVRNWTTMYLPAGALGSLVS